MAAPILLKGGIMVTHRMLINTTGKPMRHPLTGQIIMPGQSYMELKENEKQELKYPAEPAVTVQTVADPEATQKAIAASKRNKPGDK
ncbi:hypothetical protein [Desulfosporosinus sp. FKA]|uniref:hypothetical protein n=1 Tax=Desulfosporosinus sp. FKA TaxID=1969834 RepID=UPI000B49FE48|nr:hypothetical protein [Desulfosporosinus sp. FKA]